MNTCSGITRSGDACQNRVAEPGGNCGRCLGPAAGSGSQDRANLIEPDGEVGGRLDDERTAIKRSMAEGLGRMAEGFAEAQGRMFREYWPDATHVEYHHESLSDPDKGVAYVHALDEKRQVPVYLAPESKQREWQETPPLTVQVWNMKFIPDAEFERFDQVGRTMRLYETLWDNCCDPD